MLINNAANAIAVYNAPAKPVAATPLVAAAGQTTSVNIDAELPQQKFSNRADQTYVHIARSRAKPVYINAAVILHCWIHATEYVTTSCMQHAIKSVAVHAAKTYVKMHACPTVSAIVEHVVSGTGCAHVHVYTSTCTRPVHAMHMIDANHLGWLCWPE